ncbi:MAG: tetratricopeptide repeat protein [Microthrixaceae bacterium]
MWIDEGPVVGGSGGGRVEADAQTPRPGGSRRSRVAVDGSELIPLVGARRAGTLTVRLGEAARAYADGRYSEARRILRPMATEVPGSPSVLELLALSQYRLGNYREAARRLEALRELTGGAVDQHPVLADCYRAVGRHKMVASLWEELAEASPSAELVNEGRLVMAGSLADQGDPSAAIRLLERGWKLPKRPRHHHLARGYALADLYVTVGDTPRARALMGWVASFDPELGDAARRARDLA